ncbi:Transcriptional enhancer factor TEF-1 [Hypsibius exemplaris]|uniref:Transcriptional enhancer factor TEF-1 n=1 Tax=Hypsibius exemplaris TaxID=2072580 RepID=A0A1W0WW59_HYPEX|nr:Transcriptional enhancer factor TEF-1 [Hypsibius exemplaris]
MSINSTLPRSPSVLRSISQEPLYDKLGTVGRRVKHQTARDWIDLEQEGRYAIDSPGSPPNLLDGLPTLDAQLDEGEERYLIDPASKEDPKVKELTQVLIDWINDELAVHRIIVKQPLEEDLFDGQVLQKLIEKLENIKVEIPEVTQTEEGQKQKLRVVLDEADRILQAHGPHHHAKWTVEAIHSKYLVAMLHLLVALARYYRAPVRLPENVNVRVTVVQKRDGLLHQRQIIEEVTTTYDEWGLRQERDAFDTLFDHAPDKLNVVKKRLLLFVNQHLQRLNLEVNDLESQFHDGVYLILLIGLLEGYFVPLYDYYSAPTTMDQKTHNVAFAYELMMDAGLPRPRARPEDIVNLDLKSTLRVLYNLFTKRGVADVVTAPRSTAPGLHPHPWIKYRDLLLRLPFLRSGFSLKKREEEEGSSGNKQGSPAGGAADTPAMEHDHSDDDENSDGDANDGNDAEGVWSPDIEQSFQEALHMYPPCGRRKIILSEEGKMYGRNELIARYIKIRTAKTRTRKQVSSHIQVLARKKSREIQSKFKDHSNKEKAMQVMAQMSSAQIVSATMGPTTRQLNSNLPPLPAGLGTAAAYSTGHGAFWQSPLSQNIAPHGTDVKPCINGAYFDKTSSVLSGNGLAHNNGNAMPYDGRAIASSKLKLLDFTSFVESQRDPETRHVFVNIGPASTESLLETIDIRQIYDKFPEKKGGLKELYDRGPPNAFFLVKFWADINCPDIDTGGFYGVSSTFEGMENMNIQCSTKVCSFGKQVVEKVESDVGRYDSGRYLFRIQRSLMCEYMVNFILKLKDLPEKAMMNSVLENFTILQVISNRETQEILLCLAFVFEVSTSDHGAQHHVYRLVKD